MPNASEPELRESSPTPAARSKRDPAVTVAIISAFSAIVAAFIGVFPQFMAPGASPTAQIVATATHSPTAAATMSPAVTPEPTLTSAPAAVLQPATPQPSVATQVATAAPQALPAAAGCAAGHFAGVPQALVLVGANFIDVEFSADLASPVDTGGPALPSLAIIVFERGVEIGALQVQVDHRLRASYVDEVIDAACLPVANYRNHLEPEKDRDVVFDNGGLAIEWAGVTYQIYLQMREQGLRISNIRRLP